MTHDRDIERLLDTWLGEGPVAPADRVMDDAVVRIAHTAQRPAWRLRSWRFPTMSTHLKLAVLAAALGAALLAGSILVGGGRTGPTTPPTPSPTPTSTAVAEASAPITDILGGTLSGGRYRFRPFDAAPTMTLDVDVPAGWQGYPKWALLGPGGTLGPSGIGIGFLSPAGLFSDACHWDLAGDGAWPQQGDRSSGATIEEFIAALQANTSYTAGPATTTTMSGYPAKRIDLELPSAVDFAKTCDKVAGEADGAYFVWGTAEADGSDLYAQGPGSRWHLRVADINGTRVVAMFGDYPGTTDADRAEAQAILDSLVITP